MWLAGSQGMDGEDSPAATNGVAGGRDLQAARRRAAREGRGALERRQRRTAPPSAAEAVHVPPFVLGYAA
jgi:hypothetical protein